jgi:hypothetical protein
MSGATMLRSTRTFIVGLAVASCFASAPQRASACSVCLAGDPIYSSNGSTAQSQGDVSAYFEAKAWRKTSGVLPGEEAGAPEVGGASAKERNDSQRLDLYLSWTPLDRITLTLDLPWAFNRITEVEGTEQQTSSLSGFSDLMTQVTGVLWRNRDVLPTTWVEGRVFAKFPTGDSNKSVDGVRDPHLQVGTGSYDFGFGTALVHRFESAELYTSASYRVNQEGSIDYEYGDVVLANVAAAVPLGHALGIGWLDRLTPGLELNYRWADYDEFRGDRYRDSGGSILYVTPSLRVALPWFSPRAPALRASVQIPTTSAWLHGSQKEDPIWMVGLQYSF